MSVLQSWLISTKPSFIDEEAGTRCFLSKKVPRKTSTICYSLRKILVPETLFYWSCRPQTCHFIKKETLTQVFSCVILWNFEEHRFYRTLPVAAYVGVWYRSNNMSLHLVCLFPCMNGLTHFMQLISSRHPEDIRKPETLKQTQMHNVNASKHNANVLSNVLVRRHYQRLTS